MRSFEFIGHIADARMRIAGDSLEELFTAAVEGMFELAKKGLCQGTKEFPVSEKIEISSLDTTILLIDFLSAVLTYSQEKKAVFCRVRFEKLTNTELKAEIFGALVDKFDEDIKAVTYHEANVVKNEKGIYETNIVFDI